MQILPESLCQSRGVFNLHWRWKALKKIVQYQLITEETAGKVGDVNEFINPETTEDDKENACLTSSLVKALI